MDPTTTLTPAVERVLQAGLLGAFVIVFGVVIFVLWRESKLERQEFIRQLKELQEARIADSKTTQSQMLDVVKECTNAISVVTQTLEQQRDATLELRSTLKEFGDELRSFGEAIWRDGPRGRS